MATTTAQMVLTSSDLLSDSLSLSAISTLTTAGTSTGVTQSSGLARKTTNATAAAAIQSTILYRANDYKEDGANKICLFSFKFKFAFTLRLSKKKYPELIISFSGKLNCFSVCFNSFAWYSPFAKITS